MTQKICEAIGKSGCYFLSLLYIAEEIVGKPINAIDAYTDCVAEGIMDAECYVSFPARLLERYTGKRFNVSHAPKTTLPAPGSFEILRFERKEPGMTWGHFVVGDGSGVVEYDPYGDSRTVREGHLASKRIIARV